MMVLAGHDVEGNIHYVVVSPADAPPATVTTEASLLVTEVEAPEGLESLGDPKGSKRNFKKSCNIYKTSELKWAKPNLYEKSRRRADVIRFAGKRTRLGDL